MDNIVYVADKPLPTALDITASLTYRERQGIWGCSYTTENTQITLEIASGGTQSDNLNIGYKPDHPTSEDSTYGYTRYTQT